jgi:TetR/AcrR family transcriptional repressor of nem operon
METFWEHGYDRTSTALLEQRMKIGRSSLYATFGTKDELFAEAIDAYADNFRRRVIDKLGAQGPAVKILQDFFLSVADRGEPGGERLRSCLMLRTSLSIADQPPEIRTKITRFIAELDDAFHALLERAKDEGTLAAGTNLREVARFLTSTLQALNVAAHAGRSRRELREIARRALSTLD